MFLFLKKIKEYFSKKDKINSIFKNKLDEISNLHHDFVEIDVSKSGCIKIYKCKNCEIKCEIDIYYYNSEFKTIISSLFFSYPHELWEEKLGCPDKNCANSYFKNITCEEFVIKSII
jgi:hypothetical protein